MITPAYSPTATERVLPRLALDFTTASLDARVTFTRSGNTATVVNSSGYVVPINADLPRFDYDPVTKVCKGLLIEESRTNLMLQSQDFSAAAYVTVNASVSTNQTTSPGNAADADKIIEGSGSLAAHIVLQPAGSLASGTTPHTASVFVKAAGRSKGNLYFNYANSPFTAVECYFDLVAKTTNTSPSSGTVLGSSITDFGNGWFRVTVTGYTGSAGDHNVGVGPRDNDGNWAYYGDGTSGLFVWGFSFEAGAFPTSYIPTTTTTVARNADVATMTGTNFSSWFNAGAGGVVARVLPSTVSGTRTALQFDDGTVNEIIALRGNTTNPELYIVDGGTPQAQVDAGTIAANTAYNLGAAWNTDNCAAAVNGGAAVTDTTATIPTVTQVRLGSDGTNYLNGQIQTVRYWPQRIINAEVQAFSK